MIESQSRWVPQGIEWIAENAAEIDPVAKSVVTDGGKSVLYDFLVVAPGLESAFDAIEGFDPAMIGSNGLGCVYLGPDAALGTYRMMAALVVRAPTQLETDRIRAAWSTARLDGHELPHGPTLSWAIPC